MKIVECGEQGSFQWLKARLGKPTASEFDNLVSPAKLEIRKGETPETYLAAKLAEAWRGAPLPAMQSNWAIEQGVIREKYAIPGYEFDHGVTIRRVGFITDDEDKFGCSPDGLIGEDRGIEIKCPMPQTHVRYLLDGELPAAYRLQVQGSMMVTGFKVWEFLSYCPGFPEFTITVERDEAVIEKLSVAIGAFLEKFNAGMARLIEINGGPPPDPKDNTAQSYADFQRTLETDADKYAGVTP